MVAALVAGMRTAIATTIALAASFTTFTALGTANADRKERTLDPSVVEAHVKPYFADIEKCYLGTAGNIAGAGKLELDLVIHRDGRVFSAKVATPGLGTMQSARIETCVRNIVESAKFPVRRDFTTAVVPYFFQKTFAPNAGPIQSCYSAKGCWAGTNIGREMPEPKKTIDAPVAIASAGR